MADSAAQPQEPTTAPAPAEQGGKKKDDKKARKEAAQAEREAKAQAERAAAKAALQVTFEQVQSGEKTFGELPMIRSTLNLPSTQSITGLQFSQVKELTKEKAGQDVCIRVRIHTVRGKGKSAFLLLRQGYFFVQAAIFAGDAIPADMVKFVSKLSKESVIEIVGTVNAVQEPIQSATQKDVEIGIKKIFLISEAITPLPYLVEEAMLPDPEDKPATEAAPATTTTEEGAKAAAAVSREVRLDNRVIDLRAPAHIAIYKIQSAVQLFFRNFLYTQGFTEIHTPKLISTASEGGANVFQVKYFGSFAYLAQSPQLYKQMAVEGDLMRVFEIAPVFRAENSNTHRHLTEFMGLDLEMEIKHHYSEVLDVLNDMFVYIFEGIERDFQEDLKIISQQYPFEPIKYEKGKKNLRIPFSEAIRLLNEDGANLNPLDDIGTADEKRLGKIIKAKYNTDFYMVDRYPMTIRPFYTMPCQDDASHSNSYDLFIRGEEIASGAQRIHDAALLLQIAAEKGVNLKPIQAYVDAFKYGAWPHGGAGIGLERVTMLYLGIPNVRKVSMFPRDPKRLTP